MFLLLPRAMQRPSPGEGWGKHRRASASSGTSPATPVDRELLAKVTHGASSDGGAAGAAGPSDPECGNLQGLSGGASSSKAGQGAPPSNGKRVYMLTAIQATDILEACRALKAVRADKTTTVHGWRLVWKLRKNQQPQPTAPGGKISRTGGDLTAHAPNGERFHSMVAIGRRLGLEEELPPAAKKPRKEVQVPAPAPPPELTPFGVRPAPLAPLPDGRQVLIAERLLDLRWVRNGKKKQKQYLVRWQGYSPDDDTWEDEENILDERLVEELFEARNAADAAEAAAAAAPSGRMAGGGGGSGALPSSSNLTSSHASAGAGDADAKLLVGVGDDAEDGDEEDGDEEEDDDEDDSDSSESVALCGTFGCTLPDKHKGLHVIPELAKRQRNPRQQLSPSGAPGGQKSYVPRIVDTTALATARPRNGGSDAAGSTARRRQYNLSPSKVSPSNRTGFVFTSDSDCPACRGRHRAHTCGLGSGSAQAVAEQRASDGGTPARSVSDANEEEEAGDEEDEEECEVMLGPEYQATVPRYRGPYSAASTSPRRVNSSAPRQAAAASKASALAFARQQGDELPDTSEHVEPTPIEHTEVARMAAEAIAAKLTRFAYLEHPKLANAVLGTGSAPGSAVAAAAAAAAAAVAAAGASDGLLGVAAAGLLAPVSAHALTSAAFSSGEPQVDLAAYFWKFLNDEHEDDDAMSDDDDDDDDAPGSGSDGGPSRRRGGAKGNKAPSETTVRVSLEVGVGGVVSCPLRLKTTRRKVCGTLGCTLPDRHSGLHNLPVLDEPRKRRHVVALEATSSAPQSLLRGGGRSGLGGGGRTGRGRGGGRGGRGVGTSAHGASNERGGKSVAAPAPVNPGASRGEASAKQRAADETGGISKGGSDASGKRPRGTSSSAAGASSSAKATEGDAQPAKKKPRAEAGVYRVEKLLARRWKSSTGRWQYLVRWEDFEPSEDTCACPFMPTACSRALRWQPLGL